MRNSNFAKDTADLPCQSPVSGSRKLNDRRVKTAGTRGSAGKTWGWVGGDEPGEKKALRAETEKIRDDGELKGDCLSRERKATLDLKATLGAWKKNELRDALFWILLRKKQNLRTRHGCCGERLGEAEGRRDRGHDVVR